MNFEQIDQSEKKYEDVFSKGPVIVGEDLTEKHLEDYQEFIEQNMGLIHRFDTARNQEEATMLYNEAVETNDPKVVKEIYDFVKMKKSER